MTLPLQPIVTDTYGTKRFRPNKVVEHLLEKGSLDLNALHQGCHDASDEDWDQFNQLIGYSVGGLPYRNQHTAEVADRVADSEEDELVARARVAEEALRDLKDAMREPIAGLFKVHPEDLK